MEGLNPGKNLLPHVHIPMGGMPRKCFGDWVEEGVFKTEPESCLSSELMQKGNVWGNSWLATLKPYHLYVHHLSFHVTLYVASGDTRHLEACKPSE